MDRRTLIAAGLSTLVPALANAQVQSLPRREQEQVKRATAYLQQLTTAKGRFVQTNARGTATQGTLYLNRPGKARFEYDAPAQMLVVADGKSVWVSDRRLKTKPDRYPLGATPLGIFLSRRISLDDSVVVSRVQQTTGGFAITVRAASGASGSLTLDFADAPLVLRGWTVIDAKRNETRIQISELAATGPLAANLFMAPA